VAGTCLSTCGDGFCVQACENCTSCPADCGCDDSDPCTFEECTPAGQCEQTGEIDCPTIQCPPNLLFECSEVGPYGDPTTGPCEIGFTVACTEESQPGELPQEQTITRTCTVTNDCDHQSSCEQTIIIDDSEPPVITCPPNLEFECDDIGDFGEPIVTDNCNPNPLVTIEVVETINDCTERPNTAGIGVPPKLTIVRTVTASDGGSTQSAASGGGPNTVQCVQTIDIFDTNPPLLVGCPTEVTACAGSSVVFTPPTCTDPCGSCSVGCVRSDGNPINSPVPPDQTVSVTCTATDECLNEAVCEFPITVSDDPDCVSSIPTVSEWGLAVLTLLLLVGAKLSFGRRTGSVST